MVFCRCTLSAQFGVTKEEIRRTKVSHTFENLEGHDEVSFCLTVRSGWDSEASPYMARGVLQGVEPPSDESESRMSVKAFQIAEII